MSHPADPNPAPDSKIVRFSFWKPDPVPPKNDKILPIDLHSLGRIEEVTERLFEVPHMAEMPKAPWEEHSDTMRLQWQVEEGVILKVRAEAGPPAPGEILTINATTIAPKKVFFRLYVQLFEQFGVTVLDEEQQSFFTPREFRALLAG